MRFELTSGRLKGGYPAVPDWRVFNPRSIPSSIPGDSTTKLITRQEVRIPMAPALSEKRLAEMRERYPALSAAAIRVLMERMPATLEMLD